MSITDLDWEIVMMVVMAVSGLSVMYADFKREQRDREILIDIVQRLSSAELRVSDYGEMLEGLTGTASQLSQRLQTLETRMDFVPVERTVRRTRTPKG